MIMNLNRAQIIGNLTRDPELRQVPSGQSVCSFGVATNRAYTDKEGARKEEVEFHHVVAWGKLAEICSQYLTRGRQVFIEGRLRTREWQGQDGAKRNRTEIVAENMIMLGSRPGGASASPVAAATPSEPATVSAPAAPADEGDIKVEEIPF